MRIAEVIGRITLSQCHPSVRAATWVIGVPLSADALKGLEAGRGEPFVIYDELGASPGALIAVSEGGEAAAPFNPNPKPLDGYNAAILDIVRIP
jgi:ethanolamine utilization protein EutN